MRRVYRRKRPFEYLLPFLIFVGLGVIGVLGFQLWNNLQGAKGDVYFYVASGKAKLLQYGMKEWENAYSGTKLLLGDSVKTVPDSRGVLQFFNGTLVRLDGDTEVTITDITKRSDIEKIGLTVNHGTIWVNKMKSEGVDQSDLQVRTSHMLASDSGSVFDVESNTVETVRVVKGNVNVQILGDDAKSSVLDTIQVGVGQEMNLDQAVLQAFQNHETPSVLMALSDQFKLSDWYLWNSNEDQNPSDFSLTHQMQAGSSEQPLSDGSSGMTQQQNPSQTSSSMAASTQQQVMGPATLVAPTITDPNQASSTTDQSKVSIKGTVGSGTAKVVVRETVGGATDEYTLSKFKAGDAGFTYNVSEALGNFKPGLNTYSFYAVGADGKKSESADIQITYNKAAVQITDALTAPVVLTYNGSSAADASTVTVSVVKVQGSVAGAQSVYVNGYQLSKFVAGDKTWTYYANEAGGNLNPGLNEYQAYAVDPQGNKSDITKFTITYNKPAQAPSAAGGSTQAAGTTQQSASSPQTHTGF